MKDIASGRGPALWIVEYWRDRQGGQEPCALVQSEPMLSTHVWLDIDIDTISHYSL